MPDKETKTPVEGLLYFSISGAKLKPKDVSLVYNGAAGKLIMDSPGQKIMARPGRPRHGYSPRLQGNRLKLHLDGVDGQGVAR